MEYRILCSHQSRNVLLVILEILLHVNLAYSRCSINVNRISPLINQSAHACMSEWLRTAMAEPFPLQEEHKEMHLK